MSTTKLSDQHLARLTKEVEGRLLTLGELVSLGEELDLPLSYVVVAEAMIREGKSYDQIIDECFASFAHNLGTLDGALKDGSSFVLGTVAADLARQKQGVLIDDAFIDRALMYTLAAEVGNHDVGLRPCAGTGDFVPIPVFSGH